LVEVVGNAGTPAPAQIVSEVPKLNVGVMFGLTVTVNVVVVAHCPADGVNVYVPEFTLLTTEGFQVPVMLFVDVVGREGTVPPEQIISEVPKVNAGTIFGFTVTVFITGIPHKPGVGVKVYVPVAVLLTVAGLHVPVIPLSEVVGNIGAVDPAQIGGIELKVGVITGFDKMRPVFRSVVQPFTVSEKSE
jgi:hypothetical protein